ncbi:pyridoxal-phosphate dependent enzyme [Bosea caraganae]|uniref:Pyridoxal-phosphate dependent enzyme n=1 Tax=Bosea caraganae TaxID=2763117 RepID=A0A370L4G0_9HYPH|nr:pyridoxal-phosphate dependent enzyme [Bosea caraganae]RDJ22347.1 pyridoxal-phosphate dependent enzyme [Bosea caraganae]RDJ23719.1 pyridoxal-phosphate dependent enzyme [Bosea caraganae]
MNFDVTLADIQAAAARISGKVRRTPTFHSAGLSARLGVETVVKVESLQLAGSFKVRGCFNKLMSLSEDELKRGIVTVSGGNHAIAVSMVATAMGAKALVLMPKNVAPFNIELTKQMGGEVELCEDAIAAFAKADDYAATGMTNVHSYDDPAIIAGHGSLGLELASDASGRLDHVFISIGGGGFAAGVGAALKGLDPAVRIHGVETEGATTMTQALEAGKPVPIRPTSIARALGAPFATERTMAAARQFLEDIIVVPDADAVREIVWVLQNGRVLLEPAAACVVAAAISRKDMFKPGERVGLVLCGSNVSLDDLATWRTQYGV